MGLAHAKARMHDLIRRHRPAASLGRFRAIFEAHERDDFSADCLAVEFKGFFTAAIEEKVGLNCAAIIRCYHSFMIR